MPHSDLTETEINLIELHYIKLNLIELNQIGWNLIKYNLVELDQIKLFWTPPPKKGRLHDFEGVILYYLKKLFMTPHLDSQSTTEPNSEMLSHA